MLEDQRNQIEILQRIWKETKGDIREYTAKVSDIMRDMPADNHQLFLQVCIAVAQLPPREAKPGELIVESIVSGRDHLPYISIKFGGELIQMPLEDARQHAHQVLCAAEAAESDAFLLDFLGKELKIHEHTLGNILTIFRKYRQQKVI